MCHSDNTFIYDRTIIVNILWLTNGLHLIDMLLFQYYRGYRWGWNLKHFSKGGEDFDHGWKMLLRQCANANALLHIHVYYYFTEEPRVCINDASKIMIFLYSVSKWSWVTECSFCHLLSIGFIAVEYNIFNVVKWLVLPERVKTQKVRHVERLECLNLNFHCILYPV